MDVPVPCLVCTVFPQHDPLITPTTANLMSFHHQTPFVCLEHLPSLRSCFLSTSRAFCCSGTFCNSPSVICAFIITATIVFAFYADQTHQYYNANDPTISHSPLTHNFPALRRLIGCITFPGLSLNMDIGTYVSNYQLTLQNLRLQLTRR